MKKNQNKFSLVGNIRKYKASAKVKQLVYALKIVTGMDAFYSGSSHHEKLQIIYANIRV